MRRALILAAAGAVLLAAALAGNALRHRAGLVLETRDLAGLAAMLQPGIRLVRPAGDGPHPAALLLSGCDGVHDNMDWWAGMLARGGRAAAILDSHAPRGLDRLSSWRLVCAGQVLPGGERAGDAIAGLETLAAMPGPAPPGTLLLGASHGGWAVLEALADLITGEVPQGVEGWQSPPRDLLAGIGGAVLLYPYCGVLNTAARGDWHGAPPLLMILAGQDSIVSTPDCLDLAEALRARGARITVRVLAGADHGFDQREKAALSPLVFDAGLRAQAAAEVAAFLAGLPPA
ncbi:dienelactone hydrolase family protein [Mangrovicoccus algicola]|uniref:Dienelactone hydrolase family protein n=1 Tax=Mangrovicoccus algicola TaxID=2771008 RepID=A0A8J6Z0G1_9RHOB|nr:dienelactone hydrolase family protein [Mangrovicoccus algicola]MBE3640279.1 dienelactone hydrolase family protein [Mangrovicoccus algicola]